MRKAAPQIPGFRCFIVTALTLQHPSEFRIVEKAKSLIPVLLCQIGEKDKITDIAVARPQGGICDSHRKWKFIFTLIGNNAEVPILHVSRFIAVCIKDPHDFIRRTGEFCCEALHGNAGRRYETRDIYAARPVDQKGTLADFAGMNRNLNAGLGKSQRPADNMKLFAGHTAFQRLKKRHTLKIPRQSCCRGNYTTDSGSIVAGCTRRRVRPLVLCLCLAAYNGLHDFIRTLDEFRHRRRIQRCILDSRKIVQLLAEHLRLFIYGIRLLCRFL